MVDTPCRECCQIKKAGAEGALREGVCFLQECNYQHSRGEIGVQCDSDTDCTKDECCSFFPG